MIGYLVVSSKVAGGEHSLFSETLFSGLSGLVCIFVVRDCIVTFDVQTGLLPDVRLTHSLSNDGQVLRQVQTCCYRGCYITDW